MGQKSAMAMPNRAHNPQAFEQNGILPINVGVYPTVTLTWWLEIWCVCIAETSSLQYSPNTLPFNFLPSLRYPAQGKRIFTINDQHWSSSNIYINCIDYSTVAPSTVTFFLILNMCILSSLWDTQLTHYPIRRQAGPRALHHYPNLDVASISRI